MARRQQERLETYERTMAVWRFVTQFIDDNGFPPTHKEIALAAFEGRTNVRRHLDRLEIAGVVETAPDIARGMRLLKRHPDVPEPEKAYMRDDGR